VSRRKIRRLAAEAAAARRDLAVLYEAKPELLEALIGDAHSDWLGYVVNASRHLRIFYPASMLVHAEYAGRVRARGMVEEDPSAPIR
jgi:hypothetical protein